MSEPLPDLSGDHRLDTGGPGTSEPVMVAHMITMLIVLAAGAVGFTIPDDRVKMISAAVGLALPFLAALWARARVSPSGRVTYDSVRAVIRAEVYAEMQRLANSPAPTNVIGDLTRADVRKGA